MFRKSTISKRSFIGRIFPIRALKPGFLTGILLFTFASAALSQQVVTQTFTTVGTTTSAFTPPAGVNKVTVECWGGGGGGGGADSHDTENRAGGGGAGGSYTSATVTVIPLTGIDITVGAGGAGGNGTSTPGNGGTGGTSSFGVLVSAVGGAGGVAGVGNNETGAGGATTVGTTSNGGAGGEAPPGGGNGTDATGSGAGGASGGPDGHGQPASGSTAGNGVTSGGGAGAAGLTGLTAGTSSVGNSATQVGGGGSGGWDNLDDNNTGNGAKGGDGFRGEVIVSYTLPTAAITYNDADGVVSQGQVLRITATFSEPMADAPVVQISLSGANTLALTNMVKVSTTEYYYDHTVDAGDGTVTVAMGTGVSANGNIIHPTPTSGGTFTADNTDPTGYTVSIDQALINAGNQTALSFTFAGAEVGTSYNYSIDDTNVGTPAITGSGVISTATDQITGIDVSSLDNDALTLTVYLTDNGGNQGADATDNVTKDVSPPTGYSVSIDQALINSANQGSLSFTFAGAEVGADFDYTIDDANGGTPAITGNGTISTATQQVTGVNVSSLDDGTLTLTVYLTDPQGNQGTDATDNIGKDVSAPAGYSVSIDQSFINAVNQTTLSFTFSGAEVGADYNYSIDDSNGGTAAIIGSGTIATATDQISGIDVSSLDDGTITLTVYLTDPAGNQGTDDTDNLTKDVTAPVITSITSNAAAAGALKIGDQIIFTATIQTPESGLTLSPTSYNSETFSLSWSTADGGATYTATYTVASGNTDQATPLQLTGVTATDAAGNTSAPQDGADVAKTIDANVPAAPSSPDLAASDDSGSSNSDDITNVNTGLDFSGTAEANATVNLYRAGVTLIGTTTATGGGAWTINVAGTLTDANPHLITARAVDAAGNESAASTALNLIVDTSAPAAPGIPNLDAGSDSGLSSTDDETNDLSPLFTGTAEAGALVEIFSNQDAGVRGSATATGGNYSIPTTLVSQGDLVAHSITARATDLAGNQSAASGGLAITLDATAPTIVTASFFADNQNTPHQHHFLCNGTLTTNTSTTEFFHLELSEDLQITDGTQVTVGATSGFTVSDGVGTIDVTCDTRGAATYHASTKTIHLKSDSPNDWDGSTTITFTATGSTNIKDVAGNELGSFAGLLPGDFQAPTLATGLVFFPNGTGAETVVFQVNETLHASVGTTITGFIPSTGALTVASQAYNSATNTITLTSTGNGSWSQATTWTYDQATGNVIDPASNEMAAFSGMPIRLVNVNLSSNNANTTSRAKTGNTITLGFTTNAALSITPTVTIGGQAASVSGGPVNYTATLVASAALAEGVPLPITIHAETSTDVTDVTATTNDSQIIYDATAPSVTPIAISSNNAQSSSLARSGNTVTLSFTVSETLFGTPVVTIGGRSATVTNVGLNYTATLLLDGTEPEGILAFSINLEDLADNSASATATTNASSVDFDKTVPLVDDITLPDANPNNTGSVDFSVEFSEPVVTAGVDASDFTLYGTAAGGTASITGVSGSGASYTVTVSNISLTGTLGLNLVDDNTIVDAADNALGGTAVNDGNTSSATTYEIVLPEPQNHVTLFSISTITGTSAELTWADAVGSPAPSGYLITVERSGDVATVPSDGSPVLDELDLVSNTTGYLNVDAGIQSATFSNLLSGVDYTFNIYPYTNSGANIDYKTDGTIPTASDNTPTAENSTIVLNSTPIPISSILDGTPSTDKANVLEFSIYDDGQDPLSPDIMALHPNGFARETITLTLRGELTLTEGANVTGFSSSTGSVATAIYTGKGTTNTITLTNGTDGTWTSGTTISYDANNGNVEFLDVNLGRLQPIIEHGITTVLDVTATYNASGSFTVPAGVTQISVEAWGAGGSGGPVVDNSSYGGASSGGGGGAYSRSGLTVIPGSLYPVFVGTGGAAMLGTTTYVQAGNDGGGSYFGNTSLVYAEGGQGGWNNDWTDYYGATLANTHGLGGQAANGAGDIRYSGGSGGYGYDGGFIPGSNPGVFGSGGGGGSSAGINANGNPGGNGVSCTSCITLGGASPSGGASGGFGRDGIAGNTGNFPGGGGGGTSRFGPFFSGAGANGRVRVIYGGPHPASGGTTGWGADNAPFKFSDLVITQGTGNSTELSNWQDIIAGAELFDGVNSVPGTVNPANITFATIDSDDPSDPGFIEDASATESKKTYTLRIWLRDDLSSTLAASVDGLNLAFRVNASDVTYNDVSNGNQSSSRLVSGHPATESGANEVQVIATQLDFTTSPATDQLVLSNVTSVSAAPDNSTVPVVRARDANGNLDQDYNATITLTNTGTIPTTPGTVNMSGGTAVFPAAFQYQNAGDGTLTASTSDLAANGLAPADGISTAVNVEFAELSTLSVFSTDVISTNSFYAIPFVFSITDDGGPGGDGAPTRITQLKITKKASANPIPDWREILDVDNANIYGPAWLYDGVNDPAAVSVSVAEDSITFSNLMATPLTGTGFIGDGQTKTFQLYIFFKPGFGGTLPETVDHLNFDFEVDPTNIILETQSSQISPAQVAISSGPIDVDVDAAELRFTTEPPADVLVNADLATSPVVEAVDRILPSGAAPFYPYGNRDLDFAVAPTITNADNLGMTNMPASFADGVLAFPVAFQYTQTGDGTLTVSSAGVASATSTNVNVRVGVSGTITAGGGAEPATLSSLDDTDGEKVQVFDFTITDDGSTEDDGNPTLITGITITQRSPNNTITNWADAIAVAELSDGTNTVTGTVNPANITFALPIAASSDAGYIADNGNKTYELRIYLRSALGASLSSTIDGLQFGFEVLAANVITHADGTSIIATENENSGAGTEVTVDATRLTFTTPSTATTASLNVAFAVTVEAQDANGNLDIDFEGPTSAITDVTNTSNATMANAPVVGVTEFTNGVLTFDPAFQFTSGNNNDDVTLTVDAGAVTITGTSSSITLASSFESVLVLDQTFTPVLNIPYIDYEDITTEVTSFELARFELFDGDGITSDGDPITPDTDGAPTNIDDITFSITNPENIRSLGIYLGSTLIQSKDNADFAIGTPTTVTFDDLFASLIATDDGSIVFTIRASFFNTAAQITDNDAIQLQVESVTQSGGSQFNNTDPGNIGGVPGGVFSAAGNIEVTATRLDFVVQPAAFEGINQALAVEPEVRARDANAVVDLDHDFIGSITSSAGLSNNSFSFVDGVMNFTGLQYSSAGDGTLTVTSNSVSSGTLSSASGGSVPCDHVDVINVYTSLATGGVITSPNLPGGAVNKVIFGVTFNTPYKVSGEPKLNRFTINFSNPIAGVFNNLRVFESTNISYEGSDVNVTASIGAQLTTGINSLTVDFTTGTPRDLSLPGNSQLTYFLMVDVAETASGSTPPVQPGVVNNSSGVVITNGSVYSPTNTVGQVYTFASIFPPTLVSSYPAAGQLNVDPNQPTINLVFSVPVWTLDGEISLYDQSTNTLVQKLSAVNGHYLDGTGTLAGSDVNPLSFSLPPLLPDHVYYITIPQGDFENLVGIMDESANEYPGISYSGTLYFKTANPNPPRLLNNSSSPPANNPSVTNITLSGATINATFDQKGTAYFMIVNQGDPAPTTAQILGAAYGGTAVDRGSFPINSVYPIAQFGQVTASLNPSQNYDVWIFAENDALPTPFATTQPYGGVSSDFVVGGAGPTLTFTTGASAPPTGPLTPIPQIDICVNSYQILNAPIVIVEEFNGDFMNGGTQTFNLLLPTGFQFDVSTVDGTVNSDPTYGTLSLAGSDFTPSSGKLRFINNSTLTVSYENTTSTDRDMIVISGLRVFASSVTNGRIRRLGGNALTTAMPDLTPVADISSSNADPIEFTNSYSLAAFGATPSPITIIPDDQGQVELIPDPDPGDYGPSMFNGPGVNINQLNVQAVTKDAPFNITITHIDNNGCVSENPIQYTVYDHTAAIKGLSPDFCLRNPNFPAAAEYDTDELTQTVLFNNLVAYRMYNLSAKVPFNASAEQIINGPAWESVLQTLPAVTSSFPDAENSALVYKNYAIDGAKILNATTIPDPYSNFIETSPQGNTYYRGGSLGFVEFTGEYQSIANGSVQIPLIQNVEFFVPAVPIVEVNTPSFTDTSDPENVVGSGGPSNEGTPVFCEQNGNINIFGYPAATVGSSVGSFSLMDMDSIYIYVKDLLLTVNATSNNTGNFQITLDEPLRIPAIPSGSQVQVVGRNAGTNFTSTHTILTQISSTEYTIDLPHDPAIVISAIQYSVLPAGFTDNGNGTAILNPTQIPNNFENIRIIYTYKHNDSPCASSAGQVMRIAPNPEAVFTFESVFGENTPVASAYCEGKPITFDAGDSFISQGEIVNYRWNFNDINSGGSNINNPEGPAGEADSVSHFFAQSASYNVELVVTSGFNCSSVPEIQPVGVGAIPSVDFNFVGVSTDENEPFVFNSTSTLDIAPSITDGFATLNWDFGDESPIYSTDNENEQVSHTYLLPGIDTVKLQVTTDIGCTSESFKLAVIVPQVNLDEGGTEYFENFQNGDGGYQVLGENGSISSWEWGNPQGLAITAATPAERSWVTNLDGAYLPNEKSALYTASFDIADLTRPIMTFNSFRHLGSGDGVVVEFSTDNLNIADPNKTWTTLGAVTNGLPTGVEWYNGVSLAAKPGNEETGYGWTERDTIWRESKHSLAGIDIGERDQVVFRFSLASVNSDPTQGLEQPDLEGFGVDDLRIGNGTRTVLIENFTNTGVEDVTLQQQVKDENEAFREFQENAVGVEVVKIDYHVGFPGTDPFNQENSMDPGARALYYNISQVPQTRLDGLSGPTQYFSEWGEQEFNRRVLYLAEADINLTSEISPEGELSVTVNFIPGFDFPQPTLLHVAILEETVTTAENPELESGRILTGEPEFKYVLRKMLPNAAGTKYNTLTKGQATEPLTFTWSNANLFNPEDDIVVVAFLQDESSRRIYQAEIVRGIEDPSVVTGIEDLNASFNVYPNPADKELIVTLPHVPTQSTIIQMFDQMGKVVNEGYFDAGQSTKTISTEDFAGGVYVIQVRSEKGVLRRKVMVVHRN